MSEIISLNGYKICDKQARTQVEEAVEQIEESKTQINTLSQANESALSQIENIQTQIENIQAQSAGSATKPIYFSNGEPIATTYELNATVPSGAKFTDTTYSAATTSAAGLMSASDKTKLNATTDYIVAQGTSGNWYYEKYASGRARCTGQFTYTNLAYSSSSGSGYYNTSDYINFPFSFTDRPHVYGTIWAGAGLMSCSINHLDLNSVGFYIFCTLEYTNSPDLFVLAEGWWK